MDGVPAVSDETLSALREIPTQTLIDAILEIGADRILFSTDWPFENIDHAADWFDVCSISEADRRKIGRTWAQRELRLRGADGNG